MPETGWARWAVTIIKVEMKRRRLSYRDLAEKLSATGVHSTERNVTNKINRGTFTAAFFLQCLSVIGCKSIRFEDE